jgi:sugar phosphate isomerase/epimerase
VGLDNWLVMKLTISTLACPDWTLAQILEACAAAGVGGVDFRGLGPEIDVTRLREFTLDLPLTLAEFRARGVAMPCFNTSVTLMVPSAQRWQEMLDEAHRYAQLAQRTGTPFMRIFGGAIPKGMSREEALGIAGRHLRQISKICKAHGTQPVLETHDAWSTSRAVRELLHEFAPDEAGVLWDVEHTCRAGEAPGETLEALGRYVRHVHVKDSVREGGKYIPKLLGEGELPLGDVMRALKRAGYDGWICLETERRWHPDDAPAPEVSVPHFARFMGAWV